MSVAGQHAPALHFPVQLTASHIRADGVSWLAVPPGKTATAAQRHPNESKVARLAVQELGFVA